MNPSETHTKPGGQKAGDVALKIDTFHRRTGSAKPLPSGDETSVDQRTPLSAGSSSSRTLATTRDRISSSDTVG